MCKNNKEFVFVCELTASSADIKAPGNPQRDFVGSAYVHTVSRAKKKKEGGMAMYKITASLLVQYLISIILHDI